MRRPTALPLRSPFAVAVRVTATLALALGGAAAFSSCSAILDLDELPASTDDTARSDASTGDAGAADATVASSDASENGDDGSDDGDASEAADTGPLYTASFELAADYSIPPLQHFGASLAFSPDGMWLAVGAPEQELKQPIGPSGVIELFEKTEGGWVSRLVGSAADFTSTNPAPGNFGKSVAFSADGQLLAVGAPLNDSNMPSVGNVFLYQRDSTGSSYKHSTVVTPPAGSPYTFGYSVAFSGGGAVADAGPYLVVGAAGILYAAKGGKSSAVFAYPVFPDGGFDGGCYDVLSSEGDVGDTLGYALASSADLNILVIGAPYFSGTGKVYIANILTFGEVATASLPAMTGTSLSLFGTSVAVASDGSSILVGAPASNPNTSGKVDQFLPPYSSTDSPIATFSAPDGGSGAAFGQSVAISDRGIAIGAPGEGQAGAVYFYPRVSGEDAAPEYSSTPDILFPADAGGSPAGFGSSLATISSAAELAVGQPRQIADAAASAAQSPVYLFH